MTQRGSLDASKYFPWWEISPNLHATMKSAWLLTPDLGQTLSKAQQISNNHCRVLSPGLSPSWAPRRAKKHICIVLLHSQGLPGALKKGSGMNYHPHPLELGWRQGQERPILGVRGHFVPFSGLFFPFELGKHNTNCRGSAAKTASTFALRKLEL